MGKGTAKSTSSPDLKGIVVDPVKAIYLHLQRSGEGKIELEHVRSPDTALHLLAIGKYHLIVIQTHTPIFSGIQLASEVVKRRPEIPQIILTTPDANIAEEEKELAKAGLPSPIVVPDGMEELERRFLLALESAYWMKRVVEVKQNIKARFNFDRIITHSSIMEEVLARVARAVRSRVPILILGESGAGKELIARMIHQTGDRARKPFVIVNCAAIPEGLLESQFFGYEKGAFTGATSRTIGKIEAADGGTLFLDEIGEMSPYLQAKLLRVLEYGEFERVGGTETIKADVRIITATNRDLEKMTEEGKFRSDLYYRICVYPITLPPLRSRREDIPLLVHHFLLNASARNNRRVWLIEKDCLHLLSEYPWPGNIRELENAVERAVLLSDGVVLRREDFPTQMEWWLTHKELATHKERRVAVEASGEEGAGHPTEVEHTLPEGVNEIKPLAEIEKEMITRALLATNGNISLAAHYLGIGRSTLYRKIQEYEIDVHLKG